MTQPDILDRAWTGWREWVRAVTTFGGAAVPEKKTVKRPTATYLKPDLKQVNRVRLKRDLDLHRRPRVKGEKTVEMKQLRRIKVEITDPKKGTQNGRGEAVTEGGPSSAVRH